MTLDQDQAAALEGVARWRAVYHHTNPDRPDRVETITWFELTADNAWAEAAAQLPPDGYHRPDLVSVERGTFTPLPEGGLGWQPLDPPLTARVDPHGLVLDHDDNSGPGPVAVTASAGQQNLF